MDNINKSEELYDNVHSFSLFSREKKLDFLEKLKQIRSDTVARFLHEAYASEKDKQVQKAIKKLLFRLKTSGIVVDELPIEGESVLRKVEEKRDHRGLFSNFDEHGTRVAMIAFEGKRNAYVLVHGLIHFSQGLLELANAPLDGRSLKQLVAQYLNGSMKPLTVVEIAPRYASYILEEAARLSGRYSEEMNQMKALASRLGGLVAKPADIYSLGVGSDDRVLPMNSILSDELFEPFSIMWDTVDDDRKAFQEIGGSATLVLPPYMVAEKREEYVKNLIGKNNLERHVPFMKRLLEDYAYIFYARGDLGAYKSVMEVLGRADGPRQALAFFVRKSLEARQEPSPGLIVNPYDQIRNPR